MHLVDESGGKNDAACVLEDTVNGDLQLPCRRDLFKFPKYKQMVKNLQCNCNFKTKL